MRGGKRRGAGRKPSGKRRIIMYGTAAEEVILRKTLLKIRREGLSVKDNTHAEESEICHPKICPDCGKPMKIKTGKNGDFWGCNGYPECRHTESI